MEGFLRENEATILFVGMVVALVIAVIAEVVLQRRPETETTLTSVAKQHLSDPYRPGERQRPVPDRYNRDWPGGAAGLKIVLLRHVGIGFSQMFMLAVFTLELYFYLFRRALHAFPILWRLHAVHHSDTEVRLRQRPPKPSA